MALADTGRRLDGEDAWRCRVVEGFGDRVGERCQESRLFGARREAGRKVREKVDAIRHTFVCLGAGEVKAARNGITRGDAGMIGMCPTTLAYCSSSPPVASSSTSGAAFCCSEPAPCPANPCGRG